MESLTTKQRETITGLLHLLTRTQASRMISYLLNLQAINTPHRKPENLKQVTLV